MEIRRSVTLFLLMNVLLILPQVIHCDDKDDQILQGINSFRQNFKLAALTKQDKAACVADEIANKLEKTPCTAANTTASQVATNYPDVLKKCGVDPNSTADGLILPVCVPGRVETLVLTNYTQAPQNARYLNDSRFAGAGIGSEEDWTVLILTTAGPGGGYVSGGAASFAAAKIFSGHYLLAFISLVLFLGSSL